MSVSVSRSLAYIEQGRSTCSVSRSLSVELFLLRSVCLSRISAHHWARPAFVGNCCRGAFFSICRAFLDSQRVSIMYICSHWDCPALKAYAGGASHIRVGARTAEERTPVAWRVVLSGAPYRAATCMTASLGAVKGKEKQLSSGSANPKH